MEPEVITHAAQAAAVTFQTIFNIGIALVSFVGGIALNRLFIKLDKLTDQDEQLSKNINDISIELPTKYVMKEDLQRLADALFAKLDKIDAKLDRKEDKK